MPTQTAAAITAKDLRVDNWVLKDGVPHQVTWHSLGFEFPPFEPIPLTPEILEKCSQCEKTYNLGTYKFPLDELNLLNLYVSIRESKSPLIIIGSNYTPKEEITLVRTIQCDYLHQLQNIYFIFKGTGEELEINL